VKILLQSVKLGPVMIDDERLITFPEGIPGFPSVKQYALVENDKGHPFFWLQAVEDPGLAFVVTDPLIFKPDYRPALSPEELKELEIDPSNLDSAVVLTILTIPHDDPLKLTANLLGPLVINTKTRKGKQFVLSDQNYSHQELLPLAQILSALEPGMAGKK
jgi:flagellar assembly factor FliW